MYLFLILFFLSLSGIVIMIWREIVLIKNGQIATIQHSHPHPFVPELQKIKHLTFKNVKKIGYVSMFVTLKFFIKSSNFLKIKGIALIKEIKNIFKKNKNNLIEEMPNKREVSKYLKVISEYQQKIREMKDKIKEEEGIE